MKNLERIKLFFEENRNSFVNNSLEEVKNKIQKIACQGITVLAVGPIDEKILICFGEKNKALICSVDKILKETEFFSKYSYLLQLHECSKFTQYCNIDPSFISKLCSPKIALLSLAKKDIYTFPRFALGISDIAHAIRKTFSGSVSLHDLQLDSSIESFVEFIKKEKVDIVGISMTFGLFDVLEDVLDAIHREKLDCKIAIGGSLTGITFKEILSKYPSVIVSLSEGETFFQKLIDYFNGECKLEDIPAIAFVKGGKIVQTQFSKYSRNAPLSIPELDLLLPTIKAKGVFQLETSRGCYNACSFCPRRQKGIWRGCENDVKYVETLINHFCALLKRNGYDPSKFIMYVVDEEFVGGESDVYQQRAINLSKIFAKHNLKYETSFRMNTIYSSHVSKEDKIRKIKNMIKLRDNGLNRTLVGVESGVQSVLERFNKNVTSEENKLGIRLLTGLDVPIRFTYITFDPLMSMEELEETYYFQGRTDLVLKSDYKDNPEKLLEAVTNEDEVSKLSKGIPFYSQIPYMLVSIECLLGSKYLEMVKGKGLAKDKVIKALGKQQVEYIDKRIEKMSYYSQLWIDRNFALDYSLKSLAKIYSGTASLDIRNQRIVLKKYAYELLGKMLYIVKKEEKYLQGLEQPEIEFLKNLSKKYESINTLDNIFKTLLNHNFDLLKNEIDNLKFNLNATLSKKDYENISNQIDSWYNKNDWSLLHGI